MGIWPLQNVVLWRSPYERVYISQRLSSGYCVYIASLLLIFGIPVFLAYSAGNLWIKEDFYREQPLVRFLHEYTFAVDGETQSRFWSTDEKLNDFNQKNLQVPIARYTEIDADTDGINEELRLVLSMPISEPVKRVSFMGVFNYFLQDTVRLKMKSMIVLEETNGLGASGARVVGQMDFRQKNSLRSVMEPRTVYNSDPMHWEYKSNFAFQNLAPYSNSGLLENYIARNETTILTQTIPCMWDYRKRDVFELEMRIKIPQQVVYFTPGALAELKNAWIHFLSFLIPSWYIIWWFVNFIYTNQIVQTYVASMLPFGMTMKTD